MKTMKNDPAVKAVSLPKAGSDGIASDGVAFHAKNKKGTETDVTVKGITLDDLIAIAGLKDGAELISATPTSSDEMLRFEGSTATSAFCANASNWFW